MRKASAWPGPTLTVFPPSRPCLCTPINGDKLEQIMRPLGIRNGFLQMHSLQKRPSSSSASLNFAELEAKLTSRRLPLIYDYLTPQPSHLLDISLDEFLPKPPCVPDVTITPAVPLPSIIEPRYMPIGHHLVYFPPQVPNSHLLADGTDALHSPGSPFNRRMWAGGSARFYKQGGPLLNGQRAVCVEGIRDVTVKGKEGDEKVFVGLERRVAAVDERENEQDIRRRIWTEHEGQPGDALVVEKRNLVFMRDRYPDDTQDEKSRRARIAKVTSKAQTTPALSQTIVPSRALLFRYSALTFNAHSIHLDRSYARNIEGYDDLLVHGPLTLTLMLTLAQRHLSNLGKSVASIEYRNLAPLLVERPMRICFTPKQVGERGAWDIRVEGDQGGLAVRGTVETGES